MRRAVIRLWYAFEDAEWLTVARLLAAAFFVGLLAGLLGACGPAPDQRADAARQADTLVDSVDSAVAASSPPRPRALVAAVAPSGACRVGDAKLVAGDRATLVWLSDGRVEARKYGSSTRLAGPCDSILAVRKPAAPPPPPAPVVAVTLSAEVASMGYHTGQLVFARPAGPTAFRTTTPAVCHVLPDDGADSVARVYGDAAGTCGIAATRTTTQGTATAALTVTVLPPDVVTSPPPPPADTVVPPPVPPPADTVVPPPAPAPAPSPAPSPTDGTAARVVGAAELPRAVYAPTLAETPTTRTVRVPAGGDWCAALRAAQPGDRVALAPGAVYRGPCAVRGAGRGAAGWVVLTTDGVALADRVPEGTRMTPALADSLHLATIEEPATESALSLAPGAGNLRVTGVRVRPAPGLTFLYVLVAVGDHQWSDPALYPDRVVLDRVVVDGGAADVGACVRVSGTRLAVLSSSLVNCHARGRDGQAVSCIAGAGPYALVNNYLEGSGENVMCGGADARAASLVPADITVAQNHVRTPRAWQGVWTKKNLFELKVGRRVLVEGNVFEGNWTDGQAGTGVPMKSVNQDCGAAWSETSDVVVRGNLVRDTEHGINLAAAPEAYRCAAVPFARVAVVGNVVETTGGAGRFLELQGVADVLVDHNTAVLAKGALRFNAEVAPGLVFTNNRVTANPYGDVVGSADGHGRGDQAMAYHAPGGVFRGNAVVGTYTAAGLPSTNGAPAPDAGADTAAVRAAAERAIRGRP